MNIWIDENIPWKGELFAPLGRVYTFTGRTLKAEDLKQADALIVRSVTRVDEELLKFSPCTFVGTATIGEDHIDKNFLSQNKITFASAPGSNAQSVAQYITSALGWLTEKKNYLTQGKTLGIIGWGHVGRALEGKARALGMRILRSDPPLALQDSQQNENFYPKNHWTSLPEILENSDIISFHVPLTQTGPFPTFQMASTSFLKKMKKDALIINTSRGKVIDTEALSLLATPPHWILDVYPQEPHPADFLLDNALLATPHIAGYSTTGKLTASLMLAKALHQHLQLPGPTSPPFPTPDYDLFRNKLETLPAWSWASAVQAVYSVYTDFQAFMELRKSKGTPLAFDQYRKNYPGRLEFSQYSIKQIETIWKTKPPLQTNFENLSQPTLANFGQKNHSSLDVLKQLGFGE